MLIKIISINTDAPPVHEKLRDPNRWPVRVCVRDSFREINSILFRGRVFWQSRFILADFCFRLFLDSLSISRFVFFYYNRLPFSPHGGKTCNLFGWSRFACQVEAVPNLAKADGRRGGGLPAGEDPYRLRNQTVSPNLEEKEEGVCWGEERWRSCKLTCLLYVLCFIRPLPEIFRDGVVDNELCRGRRWSGGKLWVVEVDNSAGRD